MFLAKLKKKKNPRKRKTQDPGNMVSTQHKTEAKRVLRLMVKIDSEPRAMQ